MMCTNSILSRESSHLEFAAPLTVERNGKRGRPRKNINLEFLQDAMSPQRRLSLQELANKLGIHRNTLR